MSKYQRSGRGQRNARARKRSKSTKLSQWLYLAIPAVIVVALVVVVSTVFQGRSSFKLPEGVVFPAFVMAAPVSVREAYGYAVEHPEVLRYMPCYCGCGQHSGHTSIHDCFVQRGHLSGGTVAFDDHGANCDMCVEIALDAKKFVSQGKTLREIRDYVVREYSRIGPATDTPPIP